MIESIDIVFFRCGGWRVAGDAHQARASRAMQMGDEVVAQLASLLGLPAGDQPMQILVVKTAAGDREFRVGGPVELRALPVEHIYALPPLLSTRSTLPGLRALAVEDGVLTLLVDLSALASSVPTEAS
ncbi:MAG TPA: hypothetical protein VFW68_15180 [Rhodocyclaceae bacterium]|nr:hypothetical protein [Rhodocyclaceae bacterium]